MDPIGIATNIASLAKTIVIAVNEYRELDHEAESLRLVARTVEQVSRGAVEAVQAGRLSQQAVQPALQGLETTLRKCWKLIDKVTNKKKLVKLFFSMQYQQDFRNASDKLQRHLLTLQVAMGTARIEFEERAFRMQFEHLSQLAEQASGLRCALKDQMERRGPGCNDQELRQMMMECLRSVGMDTQVTPQDVSAFKDELEELRREKDAGLNEIDEIKRQKEQQEEEYLTLIAKALEAQDRLTPMGSNSLTPQLEGAGSSRLLSSEPSTSMEPFFIPPSFLCPITFSIMKDPVMVETGHSFEREAIERHFRDHFTNPCTNAPVLKKDLTPNLNLRNAIEEWLQKHNLTAEEAEDMAQQQPVAPVVSTSTLSPSQRPDRSVRSANTHDEKGLLQAVKAGNLATVQRLSRDSSVNPNATDEEGCNALHLSCREHGADQMALAILASNGLDVNAKTKTGWTALHYASRDGKVEVVKKLLDAGAAVEAASSVGLTALMSAAYRGHQKVVETLLRSGAMVNTKTKSRWTALHYASDKGHMQVVRVLLREGAMDGPNKDGNTAYDLAVVNGHKEVAAVL